MVLFGQSGCIREKGVVFGHELLYSGKVVVFEESGCIQAMWFYSDKVVV